MQYNSAFIDPDKINREKQHSAFINPEVIRPDSAIVSDFTGEELNEYDKGLNTLINRQDLRAFNQSTFQTYRNGILRLLPTIITKTGTGAAQLVGGAVGLAEAAFTGDTDNIINYAVDNAITKGFESVEKGIKEEVPVYSSREEQNRNFLHRALTDASYWSNDIADGAAFWLSAYLTGKGFSALLSPATKLLYGEKTIEDASKILKPLVGQETLNRSIVAGISRASESFSEASQTRQQLIEYYKDKGLDDEEAIHKAAQGAKLVFGYNMLLAPLEYFQQGALFKTFSALKSGIKGAEKSLLSATIKSIGENVLSEGLIEENYQKALQDYAFRIKDSNYDLNISKDLSEVLTGMVDNLSTKEGWDAIGAGAILGAIGGGSSRAHQYISSKEDNRYKQLQNELKNSEYLNSDFKDYIKVNKDNNIIINDSKLLKKLVDSADFITLEKAKDIALAKNDERAYKTLDNIQFANWAREYFESGQEDSFFEKIRGIKSWQGKQIEESGIESWDLKNNEGRDVSANELSNRYYKKGKEYQNLYEAVQEKYGEFTTHSKKLIYNEAVIQKELGVTLNKLDQEINKLESEVARLAIKDQGEFIEARASKYKSFPELELEKVKEKHKSFSNALEDSKKRLKEYTSEKQAKVQKEKIEESIKYKDKQDKKAQEDLSNKQSNTQETNKQETVKQDILKSKYKNKDVDIIQEEGVLESQEDRVQKVKDLDFTNPSKPLAIIEITSNQGVDIIQVPLDKVVFSKQQSKSEVKQEDIFTFDDLTKVELSKEDLDKFEDSSANLGEPDQLTNKEIDLQNKELEKTPEINIDEKTGKILNKEDKIVEAGASLAYLTKDFEEIKVLDKQGNLRVIKTTLSNEFTKTLRDDLLMSNEHYQAGDKVYLDIDKDFILKEGENIVSSYEQWKDDVDRVPIKIVNEQGKTVAYLHTLDWINPSNVVEELVIDNKIVDNIERQKQILKYIRNYVYEFGKFETIITGKSIGKRSIFIDKEYKNTLEVIKEDIPITICANGVDFFSSENTNIQSTKEWKENSYKIFNKEKIYPKGLTYLLLPTAVKGVFSPSILQNSLLDIEKTTSLLKALELHIKGGKIELSEIEKNSIESIKKYQGFNLLTARGLKEYFEQFVYLGRITEYKLSQEDNTKVYLDITPTGIEYYQGGGRKTKEGKAKFINFNSNIEEIEFNLSELRQILESTRINFKLDQFDNKELKIPILDQEGKLDYKSYGDGSYKDYIKKHTETNVNPIELSNGKFSYFDQPVILIDSNVPIIKEELLTGKEQEIPLIKEIEEADKLLKEAGFDFVDELLSPSIEESNINQELQDSISKYLIPELGAYKQKQAINFISSWIYRELEQGKTNQKDILESIESKLSNIQNVGNIRLILDNWNKLTQFSLDYLKRLGAISQTETDLELKEEGFELEKTNYDDNSSLKINPKDTLSGRLKLFLAFIPSNRRSFVYDKVLDTADFNEVMGTLSSNLHDLGSNEAVIFERLNELSGNNIIKGVLDKLSTAKEEIKKEFIVWASKHLVRQFIVKIDKGNIKTIESNRASAVNTIIQEWIENLYNTGLVKESNQQLVLDEIELDNLLKEYDNLLEEKDSIKRFDSQISWLTRLGIKLSETTIQKLKTEGLKLGTKLYTRETLFSNKSLISSLVQGIKMSLAEKEEDSNIDTGSITNNEGYRELARIDSILNTEIIGNNHKDIDNNTIYSFAQNKYAVDEVRKLKESIEYSKQLLELPYNSTSEWLKELSKEDNERFKDRFILGYFDGLKSDNQGTTIERATEKQIELAKIGLFQNNGIILNKKRLAKYLYLTASDKKTTLLIQTETNLIKPEFIEGKLILDEQTLDRLFNHLFLSEYNRISHTQKLIDQGQKIYIEGYNKGWNKFYFLPFLNKETIQQTGIKNLWLNNRISNNLTLEDIQQVKSYIQSYISNEVENYIEIAKDNGNIVGNKLIASSLDYTNKIVKANIENKQQSEENILKYSMADYLINSAIAYTNIYQTISGDIALAGKNTIEETLVKFGKRLSKDIAPGIDLVNSNEEFYNQVVVKDYQVSSNYIDQYLELIGEFGEAYRNINTTDAQEFTTGLEHAKVLYNKGFLTKEQYNSIIDKLDKGVSLSNTELNLILQPLKPRAVTNIIDKKLGVKRIVYIKSSSFPLLPELTKGTELDKIRLMMEKDSVDRLSFESAVKLGANTELPTLFDKEGKVIEQELKKHIITLSRDGFKIQQELPTTEDKEEILAGTQIKKLILSITNKIDNKELNDLESKYLDLYSKWYELSKTNLLNELKVDEIGEPSLEELSKLLKKELDSRGGNILDYESIEIEEDSWGKQQFLVPLWALGNSRKKESLLLSLVNNNIIKQKLPGFSVVMGTSTGMQGVQDYKDLDLKSKSDIIWAEGFNIEKGLKPMRLEKGKVMPSQVVVPLRFRNSKGKLLNLDSLIKIKGNKKFIDTDKLPEELRKVVCYRIPTQGYGSMDYAEIVGFLPEVYGDLIIGPKELVTKMGADFDIDKLYVYQKSTEYKEGKLSEDRSEEESIKNDIIETYIQFLSHRDVFKETIKPIDYGKFPELAKKFGRETIASPVSVLYQTQKYISGQEGKSGTGVFAAFQSVAQALIKNKIEPINIKSLFNIEINGKVIDGDFLSSNTVTNKNRTKQEVISSALSSSVDNENLQYLGKLNFNAETYNVINTLSWAGFEEDITCLIINQPIIKQYLEIKRNKNIKTDSREDVELVSSLTTNITNPFEKSLVVEDLETSIKEGLNYVDYKEVQSNMLSKFIEYRRIGNTLQAIGSVINVDSKGVGKLFFEVEKRINNKLESLDPSKITKLSEDRIYYKNIANIINNDTIQGLAYLNSIQTSWDLYHSIFPYTSLGVQKAINKIESIVGEQSIDNKYKIFEELKSYVYSGFFNNIEEERNRLLTGKNNLASRIVKLKSSTIGKENKFIQRLKTNIATGDIKYNSIEESDLQDLEIRQGFINLLINAEIKDLAIDLITYQFITGGQDTIGSIGRFIPIAKLKEMGFIQYLSELDFSNLPLDEEETPFFIDQYFQNNSYRLQKFNSKEEGVKSEQPYFRVDNKIYKKYQGTYLELNTNTNKLKQIYDYKRDQVLKPKDYKVNIQESLDGEDKEEIINFVGKLNFEEKYSLDKGLSSSLNNIYTNEYFKQLGDTLNKYIENKNLDINLKINKNLNARGSYNRSTKTISINPENILTEKELESTLLHETIHAITSDILNNPSTEEQKRLVTKFKLLQSRYKETIDSKEIKEVNRKLSEGKPLTQYEASYVYPIVNIGLVDEFLTTALTDTEFQKRLNEINFTDRSEKTLLDKFLNIVTNLLKSIGLEVADNSILKETILGFGELLSVEEDLKSPRIQSLIEEVSNISNKSINKKGFINANKYKEALKAVSEINKRYNERVLKIVKKGFDQSNRQINQVEIVESKTELLLPKLEEQKFKTLIEAKKQTISFLNKRIASNKTNKALITKLQAKKEVLEKEIEELDKETKLSTIFTQVDKDLKELDKLFNKNKLSDLDIIYSTELLKPIINLSNILFTDEELQPDSEGQFPENVNRALKYESFAKVLNTKLDKIAENYIIEIGAKKFNKPESFIRDKIKQAKEDVSKGTALFLDISRTDDALMQILDRHIRDANFVAVQEFNDLNKEIEDKTHSLKESSLFKEYGYEIFAQEDTQGFKTGGIITPFSDEFYRTRENLKRQSEKNKDGKSYYKWLRDNTITLDPRYLLNNYWVEIGGEKYTQDKIDNYKEELIKQLGEPLYTKALKKLEAGVNEFLEAYYSAEIALKDESSNFEQDFDRWNKQYSPFILGEVLEEGKSLKIGEEFISSKGFEYTYSVPRRFDSNSKETEWYDKKYKLIEKDEKALEYYEFLTQTLKELYAYLPSDRLKNLRSNFLPEVKKTVLENYKDNGIKQAGISFISKLMEELGDPIYNEDVQSIDPVTGRPIKNLPVKMVNDSVTKKLKQLESDFNLKLINEEDYINKKKEITEDKSYDIEKVLKSFALMVSSYRHKADIEDTVKVIDTLIQQSKHTTFNSEGQQVVDRFGKPVVYEGPGENKLAMLEHAIDSYYGNYKQKELKTGKKYKTIQDKKEEQELKDKLQIAKQRLKDVEIDIDTYEHIEKNINERLGELEREYTGAKIGDTLNSWTALKGLGWNVFSAINNVMLSLSSNFIYASGKEEFDVNDSFKALRIMLNSVFKSSTLDSMENSTAKKVRALMDKYDVVKNANAEAYVSVVNYSPAKNFIGKFGPMELTKRAEYFNQGHTFIAMTLAKKIKDKNGNDISLWEAYNEDGELRVDLFTQEEIDKWEGKKAENKLAFKTKVEQVKKAIHGNYDSNSPTRLYRSIIGRLLGLFRKFAGEGFATRLEPEKYDALLDKVHKGRYRSFSPLIKEVGYLRLPLVLAEQGFRKLLFQSTTFEKYNLNDVDVINMRRNMTEAMMMMSLGGVVLILGAADDDDVYRKRTRNFLLNQLVRLNVDMTFYISPLSFESMSRNIVPAGQLIKDMAEWQNALHKYLEGEDEIKTGYMKGQSRLLRETGQMIPFGTQVYRTIGAIDKVDERFK